LLFAWLLGFGATLAEPALNALGRTVQNLTNGAFQKSTLMYAVSFGVACGIAVGVAKIVFNIPIIYLILGGYSVAFVLTYLSTGVIAGVLLLATSIPLLPALLLGAILCRSTSGGVRGVNQKNEKLQRCHKRESDSTRGLW
jgi:hypothetical protein